MVWHLRMHIYCRNSRWCFSGLALRRNKKEIKLEESKRLGQNKKGNSGELDLKLGKQIKGGESHSNCITANFRKLCCPRPRLETLWCCRRFCISYIRPVLPAISPACHHQQPQQRFHLAHDPRASRTTEVLPQLDDREVTGFSQHRKFAKR